jgi:hypothetical protein
MVATFNSSDIQVAVVEFYLVDFLFEDATLLGLLFVNLTTCELIKHNNVFLLIGLLMYDSSC